MTLGEMNKALVAGISAGGAMYWQSEPSMGALHALLPAIVATIVIGALTFATTNTKADELGKVARQIGAALHIADLVAKTAPVKDQQLIDSALQTIRRSGGAPAPVLSEETTVLPQIPKG